ncbi:hypothetical protein BH23VER1_BH23VER1_09550 [soil metagenome]
METPPEFAHPPLPLAVRRPAPALVFGVLNIIFGVFGGLAIIWTATVYASPEMAEANLAVKAMVENPTYLAYSKASLALGAVGSIVLVACGIGLLLMKRWARKWSVGYGIYAIVSGVVGIAMQLVYVVMPLLDLPADERGTEWMVAVSGGVGGSLFGVVALLHPVLLIWFMRRKSVREAFEAGAAAGSARRIG